MPSVSIAKQTISATNRRNSNLIHKLHKIKGKIANLYTVIIELSAFSICVQISRSDGLPTAIRGECVHKCCAWQSFQQQCEQSERTFQELLERKNDSLNRSREKAKEPEVNDGENIEISNCDSVAIENHKIHESNDQITAVRLKRNFNCSQCNRKFRRADRLVAHLRVHSGQKPEVCTKCNKEFDNLRALSRHRLKHTDLKRFECGECHKMFKYQTSLTLHRKMHENVRRYVCDFCGKSFVRAHGLQSHLITHSTETPFQCAECGKEFKTEITLRNHRMRHEGVKKFICSECGKMFATTSELNKHQRIHTGEKPFGCELCDKSYRTQSHLAVHFRTHSGARPYECDLCPMTFAHNKVSSPAFGNRIDRMKIISSLLFVSF